MARSTKQREAIRSVLRQAARPLGTAEIRRLAGRRVPGLGAATVYRTVRLLADEGEVVPIQLPGEPPRYELRHAAEKHHHHFRCDSCDRVYDIEGCPNGLGGLVPAGFRLRAHDLTMYGTCARCASSNGRTRGARQGKAR